MASEVGQLQARLAVLKATVQDFARDIAVDVPLAKQGQAPTALKDPKAEVGCVAAVPKNPYSVDPVTLEDEKGEITLVEGGHDVSCVTAVLKNPYSFDPGTLDEEKDVILVEYGHDVGCVTAVLKNPCSSEIPPKKRCMTRCGWSLVCVALLPRTRHQQSLDEEKGEILVEYGHDVGCVTAVLMNPCSSEILPKKRSMTRCGWS